jgi:hypothetical protein
MRKLLKLAACLTVASIANVVAFAGPCEEGCAYYNTQCNNQANASYSQCTTAANSCYTGAENSYQSCLDGAYRQFHECLDTRDQQEEFICNLLFQMDEYACNVIRDAEYNYCFQQGSGQVACEFQLQQDQQYCANDYDNCLFVCSVQNP